MDQKESFEESKEEGQKFEAHEDVVVPRRRLGRTKREAVQMRKGLKSVRRALKEPIVKRTARRGRSPKKRTPTATEEMEKEEPVRSEVIEELEQGEDWEKFWKEVKEEEDKYVMEDEKGLERARQMSERERRERSLDEVPLSVKRKLEDQEFPEDEMRRKLRRSFFNQVKIMVSDQHLPEELQRRVQGMADKSGRGNQWMPRREVRQLARLLDMPITSARLHRAPRKRVQKPPGSRPRGRISVMLLQEEGQAIMVVHEKAEEVKKEPRNRAPILWRGLTMFTKTEVLQEKKEAEEIYIQIGEETFKTRVSQPEEWKELTRHEEKRGVYHQVLALQ